MESFALRIFQAVAEQGSISKAAQHLGYVQSNVTKHIQGLETELGVPLFVRHAKGITLTAAGEELLGYARQVTALLAEGKQALQQQQPPLRIGAPQTIAASELPGWLARYRADAGGTIAVTTSAQDDLVEKLRRGELDYVFAHGSSPDASLRTVATFADELCLVVPASIHTLREVKQQTLIVNRLASCPYRTYLCAWYEQHTALPPQCIEVDHLEGMLQLVAAGAGITLLPKKVVRQRSGLRTLCLDNTLAGPIVVLAAKATPHRRFAAFEAIVQAAAAST